MGREDLALAGWRGQGQENREVHLSIRSFWLSETSFRAFIWMCSFTMSMVLGTHATLSGGK